MRRESILLRVRQSLLLYFVSLACTDNAYDIKAVRERLKGFCIKIEPLYAVRTIHD